MHFGIRCKQLVLSTVARGRAEGGKGECDGHDFSFITYTKRTLVYIGGFPNRLFFAVVTDAR